MSCWSGSLNTFCLVFTSSSSSLKFNDLLILAMNLTIRFTSFSVSYSFQHLSGLPASPFWPLTAWRIIWSNSWLPGGWFPFLALTQLFIARYTLTIKSSFFASLSINFNYSSYSGFDTSSAARISIEMLSRLRTRGLTTIFSCPKMGWSSPWPSSSVDWTCQSLFSNKKTFFFSTLASWYLESLSVRDTSNSSD